jgi:NAD(P)-dependent dehydrogenase (short-subunit alcohol dehydrogenase family)
MGELDGLHVVVTGGTGALGTALVTILVDRGAHVHVPAMDDADAARWPLAKDARVTVRAGFDLSNEDDVERFYAGVPSLWASIHVAGGYAGGPLLDTTPVTARRMLSMNAMSAFLCSREAVRRIRAGRDPEGPPPGGRIVNVAARPALVPTAGVAAYAMSKAAVAALTLSLAEELKDERIWVNAVVPSTMDTPANRGAMPGADFDAWPKVSEVAETIAFLASPRNASTRGALVPVYGRS